MSTLTFDAAGDAADDAARPNDRRTWRLRRNCAASSGGLAWALALPLLFGSAAAFAGALAGYTLVALFVAVEWLAVAVAFVAYARHAHDGETVTLQDGALLIERQRGAHHDEVRLNAAWVRIGARQRGARCVECISGRERWKVAGHVAPAQREAFAADLASALSQAQVRR